MDAAEQPGKSGAAAMPRQVGEYELIEELGRGGMGIVWRARQRRLNREVALKLVREGCLPGEAAAKRFRREAEAAAAIQHPHIVTIHEVGESDDQLYLSMELVPGGSLADWMKRVAFSAHDAAKLVAKVAKAVHHAHQQGVLHRDLKPANILLDAQGEPRVCDFGLARLIEDTSTLTMTGEVLGTPAYLSPEQASGIRAVTTSSDTYSLGAILYEMLSGRPPFSANSLPALLRAVAEDDPQRPISRVSGRRVPVDLSTICLKCLEKEPHARYVSALELAEDLERWIRGEPIRARPVARVERAWKWARRKPLLAGLWFAVTMLTIGVAIYSTVMGFRLKREKATAADAAEKTKHAFARSMSDSAQRYFNVGDWMRALPALAEAIETGTGDSRLDEANRIRFGIIRRLSPKLALFRGGETIVRTDTTYDGTRLLIAYLHRAEVWDTATGHLVGKPYESDQVIGGAAFDSHRGSWVAIQLDFTPEPGQPNCFVWEPDTGSQIKAGAGILYKNPDGAVNLNNQFVLLHDEFAEVRSKMTGDVVGKPLKHHAPVMWAVLLPDMGRVLSRDKDDSLYFWDIESGNPVKEPFKLPLPPAELQLDPPKEPVFDAFDPVTKKAVVHPSHGYYGYILDCETAEGAKLVPNFHDAPAGSITREISQSFGFVSSIGSNATRQWLYLARNNEGETVRDLETGAALWTALHGALGFRGDFSGSGDCVETQSWNGSTRLWRAGLVDGAKPLPQGVPRGGPRPLTPLVWQAATPSSCRVDPNGHWLLTRGDEPAVRVWAVPENDGAVTLSEMPDKTAGIWFAGVPERFFCADQDKLVSVWEIGEPPRRTSQVVAPGKILFSGPAAGGTRIFTAGKDFACLWDSATGEPRGKKLALTSEPIFATADPSSERYALVLPDGAVLMVNAATGQELRLPAGAEKAQFSLNGQVLLTIGVRSARTWNPITGLPLCDPVEEKSPKADKPSKKSGRPEPFIDAVLSPDGSKVLQWATTEVKGQLGGRVWESSSGRLVCNTALHWKGVSAGAFSPDGTLVATGGGDYALRLCDAQTGREVVPEMRHPQKVSKCGFTADGALVWGLADNDVTVWETTAGEQVSPHLRSTHNPAFIASSADSRHLAVIGQAKDSVRIWDFRADTFSTGQLRDIAHALSAHTIVPGTASLRPLTPEEARRAWAESRALLGAWPEK